MNNKIEAFKFFVTFLSPGTLFSEPTTKEIEKWDTEVAMEMAHDVTQRHGATPYAFYFTTRGRGAEDLDSREMDRSVQYFLGGKIETIADVEARNDPNEEILLSNMKCNGYDRIIVNTNSYKSTMPFGDDDILLDWTPKERAK